MSLRHKLPFLIFLSVCLSVLIFGMAKPFVMKHHE